MSHGYDRQNIERVRTFLQDLVTYAEDVERRGNLYGYNHEELGELISYVKEGDTLLDDTQEFDDRRFFEVECNDRTGEPLMYDVAFVGSGELIDTTSVHPLIKMLMLLVGLLTIGAGVWIWNLCFGGA
jgi:hypothetical protein